MSSDLSLIPRTRPQLSKQLTPLKHTMKDRINVYKNVHVVRTCTNPDCFKKDLLDWGYDAKGHVLCRACHDSVKSHGAARPQDTQRFFDATDEFRLPNNKDDYDEWTSNPLLPVFEFGYTHLPDSNLSDDSDWFEETVVD